MSKAVRLDIQGMRALAVLSVMVFHMNPAWLPGGFVGVDIFFVISGFLISTILLKKKDEGTFRFADFYASRLTRIAPAYFVALIVTTIAASILLIPADLSYFQKSLKRALVFSSNHYFSKSGDYFSPSMHEQPLLHTWSLAVEMQFYLLLPGFILWVPRRHLVWAVPVLILGITVYVQQQLQAATHSSKVYYSLIARVPEFLVGSLAALINQRWLPENFRTSLTAAAIGALLLICSLAFIGEGLAFPGFLALVPCIGAAALLVTSGSIIHRCLATPLLVWIGELSYSLYLFHWPLLALLRYHAGDHILTRQYLGIFVLGTFALAMMSYRFIEIPLRSRPYSHGNKWAAGAVTGTAIVALSLSNVLNQRLVPRLPLETTRYASDDEICHGKIVGDCLRGERTSKQPLLLLGDSHGAQLNLFFDTVGQAQNFSMQVITASSCVPIQGFDIARIPEEARNSCRSQINAGTQAAHSAKIIFLAGKWSYHTTSSDFIEALHGFLTQAHQQEKQVVVLAQVPMLNSDPLRAHRWKSMGFPIKHASISKDSSDANKRVASVVAQHPNARFLNFSDDGFFEAAPYVEDRLVYFDRHHLNEAGAYMYGRHFSHRFSEFSNH